ncbi:MAG: hypothetical protein MUC63_06100, partial [Planctomycetes bacterium]|nr:hypothetical protein [Planctomycetota bacterium]
PKAPPGGPGTSPAPPGEAPKPAAARTDAQARAADYLGTLNGRLVAAAPPAARESLLAGIRTSAARQGVDLRSLGAWEPGFLEGAFDAPQGPPTAQYLGRRGDRERFVVPERIPEGGKPGVLLDGRPVPESEVSSTPARGGEPFTLVSVRRGPDPRPAVITVLAPSEKAYRAAKPGEPVRVTTATTIERRESTTLITVVPAVEAPAGEKAAGPRDPARTPPGATPAYAAKNDTGVWTVIFQGAELAASVLVPLGTTVLLKPDAGGSSAVRSGSDGTLLVELSNRTYDQAMAQARKNDPSFDDKALADSLQAGLSNPATGQGNGITVASVAVPGGSSHAMRPGQTAFFSVAADPSLAPSFRPGAVQVRLDENGRAVGYMPVQDAFLDPSSGRGAVAATLPPGLTSASGILHAVVVLGAASSNAVLIGIDPGAVELVAATPVAQTGSSVLLRVVHRTGGRIKGRLVIAGPGSFPGGGNTLPIDAWGSTQVLVLTTNPGELTVTFVPDADGAASEMEKKFE